VAWPEFRVLSPDDARRGIGSFGLVEGEVVTAVRRKDTWYLNFGPDWRSDFTAAIPVKRLPAAELAALDPYALQGQRVRVRGWLESYNGPMIELTHLAQLERLERPVPVNGR
jgi:micrococcal nuclease